LRGEFVAGGVDGPAVSGMQLTGALHWNAGIQGSSNGITINGTFR